MRKKPASTKPVTEKFHQKPYCTFDDAVKKERNCYCTSCAKSMQKFELISIQKKERLSQKIKMKNTEKKGI